MKLNPPASSSDLDVARQIARRLHQKSRRDDPTAAPWPSDEAPERPRLTPPPLPSRSAQAEPPEPEPFQAPGRRVETAPRSPAVAEDRAAPRAPAPPPAAARAPEPAPEPPPAFAPEPPEEPFEPRQSAHSFDVPEAPPFERPSWGEPPAEEPEVPPFGQGDPDPAPLEDLADPTEPSPYATEEQSPDEPAIDEPAMPDVDVDDPALSPEEPALSPEEMVGESAEIDTAQDDSSPLDQLTEPESSPFGDELLDAPPMAEEPAPPSWDEIVENCRGMGQAGGAMLIDPAGQVFATRGDWPAPGPNAIAGKLVAMMAKTLKDAPTRSISAPLMGMHLTAWRVPLSEGLVTVAFIGAAPVRAEARPLIDAEILSGVGS